MSPDVGEEGWVPLDDLLARIPELVERLRDPNEFEYGHLLVDEAADALEAAQARIAALTERIETLVSWGEQMAYRSEEAEQRAERYRVAVEWLWDGYRSHNARGEDGPCDCVRCENVRDALAPDPARPATEPDDARLSSWCAARQGQPHEPCNVDGCPCGCHKNSFRAADEPQEDDRAD